MSARFWNRALLTTALAVFAPTSGVIAQTAREPQAPPVAGKALASQVYPVADLLSDSRAMQIELSNMRGPVSQVPPVAAPAPVQAAQDGLIQVITTTVEPESWSVRGGRAAIAYHAPSMSLVVLGPPELQEKVTALLTTLRREREKQVALELRIVTISESLLHTQRIGVSEEGTGKVESRPLIDPSLAALFEASLTLPQVTVLNDAQVSKLMETIQADMATSIVQAPKVTACNGQVVRLLSGSTQFFVTNVDVVQADGQKLLVPRNEPMTSDGLSIAVQPAISADQRFVSLNFQANMTKLANPAVPLFPVTSFITPVFKGGAVGQPIPFTQFLQQPAFNKMMVDHKLVVPDGGTALLSGGRIPAEGQPEFAQGVLERIPYVNRLFKRSPGFAREPKLVFLLLTPRIIVHEEEETRVTANVRGAIPDASTDDVASLLKRYRSACSQGRLAAARNLANQALALDPTCFQNSGK
jgi:type II secretory pathway component GspD/PulD (secretin)